MNLLVNYTTLNTEILFKVTRKQENLELTVLKPVLHKCSKSYKSLVSIINRLGLSKTDAQKFIRSFGDDEQQIAELVEQLNLSAYERDLFISEYNNSRTAFSSFVQPIRAVVTRGDIACNCSL